MYTAGLVPFDPGLLFIILHWYGIKPAPKCNIGLVSNPLSNRDLRPGICHMLGVYESPQTAINVLFALSLPGMSWLNHNLEQQTCQYECPFTGKLQPCLSTTLCKPHHMAALIIQGVLKAHPQSNSNQGTQITFMYTQQTCLTKHWYWLRLSAKTHFQSVVVSRIL